MEQPAAQDRLIGAAVGNYVVREKLGEGGMGAVYLAEHPGIGKKVALKVLHPEFSANEEVVERFFNEAKAVNNIQHPNIVDIIDYGELPGETGEARKYFTMEFLAGEPLNKLLRRDAPLPMPRALHIAAQIADALASSHRNQIVHRDLKPDNVVLLQRQREADFVKVLDFGIAKLTGDQQISHRTRTGIVMGTPAYMSPEQCEGKGRIDHRTDVYALGILLYEMLTGRVPFQGEGYGEVLVQHLTQFPQRPTALVPTIDPHVEAVCMKALEKRADDRFATMDDMMRALQDPVGYIDGRGGLSAFVGAWATGAVAPSAPTRMLDPSGSQPYAAPPPTPYPGQQVPATPYPGHGITPPPGYAPATPYPSYGGVTPPPGTVPPGPVPQSRKLGRPVVIALAAAGALGLAGGGWLLLRGDSSAVAEVTPPDAAPLDGVEQVEPPDAAVALAEVPPDAAPEPAEPTLVTIAINSTPQGAKIFLGDSERPVGETPHELEVEQSDAEMEFRLEHPRRQPRTQSFVPNMARAYDLHLPRRRPPRPDHHPDPKPDPKPDEIDPDSFADPFK